MIRVCPSQFCDCSRIFPNEEMDQLATALRQVARMLWGIHVTLQMGFEQEASPTSYAYSCIFVHVRAYWYCNPFACSGTCQFLVLSFCTFPCCAQPTTCLANWKHSTGIFESYTPRLVSHQACQSAQHAFLYRGWAARHNTWLLIKLTSKGVVFSFHFFLHRGCTAA